MPSVLTTSDILTCINHGEVQPQGAVKLLVGGTPVLTTAGVVGKGVSSCTPPGSPPPPACTTVLSIDSGLATKLEVAGAPVLLVGLAGKSNQQHPITATGGSQSKLVTS